MCRGWLCRWRGSGRSIDLCTVPLQDFPCRCEPRVPVDQSINQAQEIALRAWLRQDGLSPVHALSMPSSLRSIDLHTRCCAQILVAPSSSQRDCIWRRVMRVPPRPYKNAFEPPSSSLQQDGEGTRRAEGEDKDNGSDDKASDGGGDVSVDAAIKGLLPSSPTPPPPRPFMSPSLGLPVRRGGQLDADVEVLEEEEEEDSDEFVGSLVLDFRGSENSVASARDRISPCGSLGE